MAKKKIPYSISLSKEIISVLDKQADMEGRSRSNLIERAIKAYAKQERWVDE